MNMTEMQAQFESWFESINHCRPVITFGGQSHWYSDPKVEEAWSIWQASRAWIAVELPMKFNGDHGGDAHHADIYDGALDECAEAIRKIGFSATFQQHR